MGNIDSICRAIEECGGDPIVSNKHEEFELASRIILPGVGSFDKAMQNIDKFELKPILKEQVLEKKKPLLGICLGMQILAVKGTEGGETEGLGFIDGEVVLLKPENHATRIPHVGWNEVHFEKNSPLFNNLQSGRDFYFVHSYHFNCEKEENILAITPYCGKFVSVVNEKNVYGVQFHPEKSQLAGFEILKNFLDL
ncbi:MAG: imidazole glycerol phosphate synthase subunit HisH [Candidatus Lokiarchaeota archaeon]|nr:imidazole glycerol phosphate synthase subunit HisH [Candidatus Lokiarchaeota archaeon]